jgi:hypothetical protein
MHVICKKYTYNHMHDMALLQIILKKLAGTDGMWVLKDALAPGARPAHLVAKLVSYLQAMMDGDTNFATFPKKNARHVDGITRNPNIPSCAADTENRRRKRTTSQRRIHAPTARSSIARSLIKSKQTSACKTGNTRAIASNQSLMSSKWCSKCHKFSAELGGYASEGNVLGED